jgi:hypothetical protein
MARNGTLRPLKDKLHELKMTYMELSKLVDVHIGIHQMSDCMKGKDCFKSNQMYSILRAINEPASMLHVYFPDGGTK